MKKIIIEKLTNSLRPKTLEVINNSHLHSGHLGDDGSGETHFAIKISAEGLENLSAIQAHRKINEILKEEFKIGMHALEIRVLK